MKGTKCMWTATEDTFLREIVKNNNNKGWKELAHLLYNKMIA